MIDFDPSAPLSSDFGIFGLPSNKENSKLILLPVPWEVTTSYGQGTSNGPMSIRQASSQLDLYDLEMGTIYKSGIFMEDENLDLKNLNDKMKSKAEEVRQQLESGKITKELDQLISDVNQACERMNSWVYNCTQSLLDENKLVGIVGGDHSTPLGAIKAISDKYKNDYAIIHIDAHADLRDAYMGFKYSHASIMYNVMNSNFAPKNLIQIGIRDFCEEEFLLSKNDSRIKTYYDESLKSRKFNGENWAQLCDDFIYGLPKNIYISFDIDGLSPHYCPNTGTPVPGGLDYSEATYLISIIAKSGRRIIGFDLNEVAPGEDSEWDGNVGARLLYKLCGWTLITNQN